MKTRLAIVSIILLALTSTILGQGTADGQPKLVIENTTHNLGDVKSGATVSHVYIVKNIGKANLEIKNIVPGCGCETVAFDPVIAPGKEGKITLQVNTTGYNGPISKAATVTTNDPTQPSFDLVIQFNALDGAPRGQAVGPFLVSPAMRASGATIVGGSANLVMTIYNTGTTPRKITGVKTEGTAFKVTLDPNQDGTRYMIQAVSSPTLAIGNHTQTVKLTTDSPETPEIQLELETTVDAPLRVGPAAISLDRVTAAEGGAPPRLSKFVFISQLGGPAFEVKGVSSTLPFLTAVLESSTPGKTYVMRVKFTGVPPAGRHQGKITIDTNIAAQPKLEIAVTVSVP
jgi:hypothetical protein